MPRAKGKGKSKGKKKTGQDALRVEVFFRVPVLRDKRGRRIPISQSVLNEARQIWADTGIAPKGFEVLAVEWQNYRRNKPVRRAEDADEIEEARTSLHLGSLFRSGIGIVQPMEQIERGTYGITDTD
jgi:hypothetical protein